jgi:hypothetical protein
MNELHDISIRDNGHIFFHIDKIIKTRKMWF